MFFLKILFLMVFVTLLGMSYYIYKSPASAQVESDCGPCGCCGKAQTPLIQCKGPNIEISTNADVAQEKTVCQNQECIRPIAKVACRNEADQIIVDMRNYYNNLLIKVR